MATRLAIAEHITTNWTKRNRLRTAAAVSNYAAAVWRKAGLLEHAPAPSVRIVDGGDSYYWPETNTLDIAAASMDRATVNHEVAHALAYLLTGDGRPHHCQAYRRTMLHVTRYANGRAQADRLRASYERWNLDC